MNEENIDLNSVFDSGVMLGEIPPKKEHKGSYSELYFHNGLLININFTDILDCEIANFHTINENEIEKYTSDPQRAKYVLSQQ